MHQKMGAQEQKLSVMDHSNLEHQDNCETSHGTTLEGVEGLVLQPSSFRTIGSLEIIALGWAICNSWASVAATMALAISQGGPALLVYGPMVTVVFVGFCAVSMAELASVYPTAGGQYHWTSILAPKTISRGLSYLCGALNACSWIAISAGIAFLACQVIIAIAAVCHPAYTPKAWHYFLLYQAINAMILSYNIFAIRRTPKIHDFAMLLSMVSFVVIIVTCIARAESRQNKTFVWATFGASNGWESEGISFLIGLVCPNYMYAGIDGTLHLAEECSNPTYAIPKAMISTIVLGFISTFAFIVAMLYSLSDFDAVLQDTMPVYTIWLQATRSEVAATVFMVLLCCAALFALNGAQQTASRLTWSLARDDAFFGSKRLTRIHPVFQVPVQSLLFNYIVMALMGCIFLASSAAFNSFIGTGLILQHITYAIPCALLIYRKRSEDCLPASRPFRPVEALGWTANIGCVAFSITILVFYDFPSVTPVTASTMNYTSVVLAIMGFIIGINWILHARKHYHGPRLQGNSLHSY